MAQKKNTSSHIRTHSIICTSVTFSNLFILACNNNVVGPLFSVVKQKFRTHPNEKCCHLMIYKTCKFYANIPSKIRPDFLLLLLFFSWCVWTNIGTVLLFRFLYHHRKSHISYIFYYYMTRYVFILPFIHILIIYGTHDHNIVHTSIYMCTKWLNNIYYNN